MHLGELLTHDSSELRSQIAAKQIGQDTPLPSLEICGEPGGILSSTGSLLDYQKLFKTLFVFLNKGFGPSDVVAAQPVKDNEAELGDPSAFLAGAYRSVMQAYVPD